MKEETIARCANCPYSSKDRKICSEFHLEPTAKFGRKSKPTTVEVKTALDSIYKFNSPSLLNKIPDEDTNSNENSLIGVCEDCLELLSDLYTCYVAFNSPRAFDSYIAMNSRRIDSILQDIPQQKVPDFIEPIQIQMSKPTDIETENDHRHQDESEGIPIITNTVSISSTNLNSSHSIDANPLHVNVNKAVGPRKRKRGSRPKNPLTPLHPEGVAIGKVTRANSNSNEVKPKETPTPSPPIYSITHNLTSPSPSASATKKKSLSVKLVRLTPQEIEEATNRHNIVNSVSTEIQSNQMSNLPMGQETVYGARIKQEGTTFEMEPSDDNYMDFEPDPFNDDLTEKKIIGHQAHSPLTKEQDYDTVAEGEAEAPGQVEQGLVLGPGQEQEKEEWIKNLLGGGSRRGRAGKTATVSRLDILQCPVCIHSSKIYKTTKDFYHHLCTHLKGSSKSSKGRSKFSQNDFLNCPVCKTKLSRCSIYCHLMIHANYSPYTCTILGCTKAFTFKSSLIQHSKTNHDFLRPGNFILKTSQAKLSRKSKVSTGRPVGRPKQVYRCENCDRECQSKVALIAHVRRKHTNDRPFNCNLCQRSFIQQSDLEHHERTLLHRRLLNYQNGGGELMNAVEQVNDSSQNQGQGERNPHQDQDQDQNFNETSNYADQIEKIEVKVEPGLVQGYEDIPPSSSGSLETQQNTLIVSKSLFPKKISRGRPPSSSIGKVNLSDPSFIRGKKQCCPVCRKHMSNLHLHMVLTHKMHSKKKLESIKSKIQCEICLKFYSSSNGLKTHQEEVHSEQNFDCVLCGKQFKSQNKLRIHVKRVHLHKEDSTKSLPDIDESLDQVEEM